MSKIIIRFRSRSGREMRRKFDGVEEARAFVEEQLDPGERPAQTGPKTLKCGAGRFSIAGASPAVFCDAAVGEAVEPLATATPMSRVNERSTAYDEDFNPVRRRPARVAHPMGAAFAAIRRAKVAAVLGVGKVRQEPSEAVSEMLDWARGAGREYVGVAVTTKRDSRELGGEVLVRFVALDPSQVDAVADIIARALAEAGIDVVASELVDERSGYLKVAV